jgi:peptidoglycan L-alanyl-D-glutamate endopeptidase CwlK
VSRRIEDMLLVAQAPTRALEAAIKRAGIPAMIWDTLRTADEQFAMYLQNRCDLTIVNLQRFHAGMRDLEPRENTYTITEADGFKKFSDHQGGRAVDIVVLDAKGNPSWNYRKYAREYRQIAEIAKKLGFKSGAYWPPINPDTGLGRDPPHHAWP